MKMMLGSKAIKVRISITDFFEEVNSMSNFNKGKKKQRVLAIVCLVLVAAMLITTFVSALFVY